MLKSLPENESMFKCYTCKLIFDIYTESLPVFMALIPKDDIWCPKCGKNNVKLMCKIDAYSIFLKLSGKVKCRDSTLIGATDLCPVCQQPTCPKCYNHSVVSLSRVTGYIQDISGWNEAKKQELKDRKHYDIGSD